MLLRFSSKCPRRSSAKSQKSHPRPRRFERRLEERCWTRCGGFLASRKMASGRNLPIWPGARSDFWRRSSMTMLPLHRNVSRRDLIKAPLPAQPSLRRRRALSRQSLRNRRRMWPIRTTRTVPSVAITASHFFRRINAGRSSVRSRRTAGATFTSRSSRWADQTAAESSFQLAGGTNEQRRAHRDAPKYSPTFRCCSRRACGGGPVYGDGRSRRFAASG